MSLTSYLLSYKFVDFFFFFMVSQKTLASFKIAISTVFKLAKENDILK